jgi:nucleoside-diphosphate-sugar epimerase
MTPRKILVTNASAFFGRSLLRRLVTEGRQVHAALREPSGVLPAGVESMRLGGMLPGRKDDVARLLDDLVVDSSHIRSALGWTPPYTLDRGLAETAARLGAVPGVNA